MLSSPRSTTNLIKSFVLHSSSIASQPILPFVLVILSAGKSSLPAEGPPVHNRFQESIAPPGRTFSTMSSESEQSKCLKSRPQLTLRSIRRCWKVNTEPPSSRITKGEGGTFGDTHKCAEGDDMSEKAARSGAGFR